MIFFPKIGIFCKSIAGPLSETKKLNGQLALTREPIELCVASYQGFYAKFVSIMSPKCLIVENDGEFLPQ